MAAIQGRFNASQGVKKENNAIANRPSGWSAKEAQRSHRASNKRAISAMRLAA